MSQAIQLHIGTYAKAGGRGLHPLTLLRDGSLHPGDAMPAAGNASFAAAAPGGLHYLVDEATGQVGLWRRRARRWQELGRVRTLGEQPCYLALDAARRRLAVANYGSGSVALFTLDERGAPIEPPSLHTNEGRGPVAERQDGPHAHCVRFSASGDALYMVDLGIDAIVRLAITDGALSAPRVAYRAPPGSGPRHLLFHPHAPLAVLVSELASTLTILRATPGALEEIACHPLVPQGYSGDTLAGHLALSRTGDRIYATNRGHDSIAIFSLAPDGRAEPVGHVASGGGGPRHLLLLEEAGMLVVAHEKDGRVTALRLGSDGLPRPAAEGVTIAGACFVLHTPE